MLFRGTFSPFSGLEEFVSHAAEILNDLHSIPNSLTTTLLGKVGGTFGDETEYFPITGESIIISNLFRGVDDIRQNHEAQLGHRISQ